MYKRQQLTLSDFLEHRDFPQRPQLLPALADDPLDMRSSGFFRARSSAAPVAAATAAPAVHAVRVRLDAASGTLKERIAAVSGIALVDQGADLVVSQHGDHVLLAGPAGDPILDTSANDPKLVKRIGAQTWLDRVMPVGTDSLGLRAETDPASRGNTFLLHENVEIKRLGLDSWNLVGVIVDITARRDAELALAAEKERLAVTLGSMTEGVLTILSLIHISPRTSWTRS